MAGIAQLYLWLICLHPLVALVFCSINVSILFRSRRFDLVATVMRLALCVTLLLTTGWFLGEQEEGLSRRRLLTNEI